MAGGSCTSLTDGSSQVERPGVVTWTPIIRALPAVGERVLVAYGSRVEIARRVDTSGPGSSSRVAYFWELESGRESIAPYLVTHWMSLPSRP